MMCVGGGGPHYVYNEVVVQGIERAEAAEVDGSNLLTQVVK